MKYLIHGTSEISYFFTTEEKSKKHVDQKISEIIGGDMEIVEIIVKGKDGKYYKIGVDYSESCNTSLIEVEEDTPKKYINKDYRIGGSAVKISTK